MGDPTGLLRTKAPSEATEVPLAKEMMIETEIGEIEAGIMIIVNF